LYNELPFAAKVAELFGTEHKEIIVKPDVVALLPRLLWHLDEPVADTAFVTTYLVSEFARQDVKVILSGVGGDELFGGYRRYLGEYYGQAFNRVPKWARRCLIKPLLGAMPSNRHNRLGNLSRYAKSFVAAQGKTFEERYQTYVGVFSAESVTRMLTGAASEEGRYASTVHEFLCANDAGMNPLDRLLITDIRTQLPDDLLLLTDKMSMATSLECRVPLLDERVVGLSRELPAEYKIRGRELKFILKRALSDVLPAEILYRKKRGFGAPMGAWLKNQLRPMMNELLSKASIERRALLDWHEVRKTIALHEQGREDHTDHLLSLINLEIWARMYLDGQSPADVSASLLVECVA
jgi:asparagine synthase (glutamine-hydrolysing)